MFQKTHCFKGSDDEAMACSEDENRSMRNRSEETEFKVTNSIWLRILYCCVLPNPGYIFFHFTVIVNFLFDKVFLSK